MIVIVMSLSVSDHFPDVPISSQTLGHKPDTNTRVSLLYDECHKLLCWSGSALYRWRHYLGEKERKAFGSCLCFIQWAVSWSDDKSYGPNTTNTFQSLSPAIHFIGIWLSTRPHKDQDIYFFNRLEIYLEHRANSASSDVVPFISCFFHVILRR